MRVVWSATVERELSEIHDYLAESMGPEAALKAVERILARGDQIAAFPELGREVADFASPSIRVAMHGDMRCMGTGQR